MATGIENPSVSAEIETGSPAFHPTTETISFPDGFHPHLKAAEAKVEAAHGALIAKLNASDYAKDFGKLQTETLEQLTKSGVKGTELANAQSLLGQLANPNNVADFMIGAPTPGDAFEAQLHAKVKGIVTKVAPEEHRALASATQEAGKHMNELRTAQIKALKEVQTLEGATAEQLASAKNAFKLETRTLDRVMRPTWFKNNYATAREVGWGAAVKENFYTGIKKHPFKSLAKSGGVVIGVIMTTDALMHSQRQGADGQMQDRSWVTRLAEGGTGIGLALGSALHGGR